jgi:hypothetical protein
MEAQWRAKCSRGVSHTVCLAQRELGKVKWRNVLEPKLDSRHFTYAHGFQVAELVRLV